MFLTFQSKVPATSSSVVDNMCQRKFFNELESSIEEITSKGDDKKGLKLGLRYLIPTTAKILEARFFIEGKDDVTSEIENFLRVFKLKQTYIFGDVEYKANNSRQVKLRKPAEIPDDEDLTTFRNYILAELNRLMDPYYLWTAISLFSAISW